MDCLEETQELGFRVLCSLGLRDVLSGLTSGISHRLFARGCPKVP